MKKDYFRIIDSQEKAYWFGFLCADGCIAGDLKSINLDLHIRDIDHIYKFLTAIESTAQVKVHGDKSQYARVRVCCKEMAVDLSNLGCTPRKSLSLQYPSDLILPKEYERDFIRGYFDGDGCLCYSVSRRKRNDRVAGSLYVIRLWFFKLLGTKEFLSGVANFLPVDTAITKHGNSNIYQIKCGGTNKIKAIMNSFYDEESVSLDRKRDKYISLTNY